MVLSHHLDDEVAGVGSSRPVLPSRRCSGWLGRWWTRESFGRGPLPAPPSETVSFTHRMSTFLQGRRKPLGTSGVEDGSTSVPRDFEGPEVSVVDTCPCPRPSEGRNDGTNLLRTLYLLSFSEAFDLSRHVYNKWLSGWTVDLQGLTDKETSVIDPWSLNFVSVFRVRDSVDRTILCLRGWGLTSTRY